MPRPGDEPHAGYQITMPGYFRAMGIPIRSGRDFSASDTHTSVAVALVNETLARREWPGQEAVGRRVRFNDDDTWMTVVGVVGDIRHSGPAVPPRPELYQPASQRSFPFMAFVVRTAGDPYAFAQTIRRAAADVDPSLPLANMKTMDEHVAKALARPRFVSSLIAAFGLLALTLAIVGIYGVMSWAVSERQREFAIRVALGVRGRALVGLVLRKAILLVASGTALGLMAARAASTILTGLLFGVERSDPFSFAAGALGLALVAILASCVPARRALRADPITLLR